MCVFSKFGIFAFPCNFLEYALIIYVFGIVTLGAEAAFSSCRQAKVGQAIEPGK